MATKDTLPETEYFDERGKPVVVPPGVGRAAGQRSYNQPKQAPDAVDPVPPPVIDGPFAHLDTAYLSRAQADLRTHVPGDATWQSHVGALLRALIQHTLDDPSRREHDRLVAERAEADRVEQERLALEQRHEQEQAALVNQTATPEQKLDQQRRDLEERQAAEKQAMEREAAARALARKQQNERDALSRRHADEAARVNA